MGAIAGCFAPVAPPIGKRYEVNEALDQVAWNVEPTTDVFAASLA